MQNSTLKSTLSVKGKETENDTYRRTASSQEASVNMTDGHKCVCVCVCLCAETKETMVE